ncbi:uncharacterized protein BXZ73DRAFT_91879 [Epithele typhae]|uniref:uncharacterized protein n=1 Tax=Epithele typhae TaxID=378194 RepID=UPI0020081EB2|nr:uncharacterized protein BXZ73DRAFT_91879 [Epithele typhae]KAH9920857.1 hypothetical protein BXZ73DRAFT_91879 [Epithele typhae]
MAASKTNLPEPSYSAVFTASVSAEIDAPIEKVWEVLTDFTKYPECQEVVDKDKKKVEDQTPAKGKYLSMLTHIPPTMDDGAKKQPASVLITHCDDETHRLCFSGLMSSWFIRSERWQALSTTEDGKTFYESREIFAGIGSPNLMKSFQAMADTLKARAEQQ